jgi:subtilisin family serine protease
MKRFFLAALVGLSFLVSFAVAATQYVEGEVIVTFKPATSLEGAKAALKKKALGFTNYFGPLSASRKRHTGLVRDKTKTTAQLIAAVKGDPSVESVEPNYLRWVNADPNDGLFSQLWGLKNTGQTVNGTAGTASDDIKFVGARALERTPLNQIVVGVLDTGLDTVHSDLVANVWINDQETPFNGIDDDNDGYVDDVHGYDFADGDSDPSDSGEHGTHVAGTIGAVGDNGLGVIGVDDQLKILPLKVSSDGNTINSAAAISALQYATVLKQRGVNIVALNASYGGGGFSSAESAAIQAAGNAGIIMCVAAGNTANNNDASPTYPANYRLSNMIVVAASDQNDALASFSNYGATTVDLAAPGTNILSTKPSTVSFQAGGTTYNSALITLSAPTTGVTGNIVDCGTGNTAAEFPSAVRGHIALVQRGTETFSTKVSNAVAAGATAVIIYNNTGSPIFNGTLESPSSIPARAISRTDGSAIKAALPETGAIVVSGNYQYLDGTSMATPHVTGAVAFAAMNFPADTVAQRRQRLLANVDARPGLQGKMVTGGRLNLLRIVDSDANGVADWQPVITTSTLPSAVNGDAYSQTLAATGGALPYTWTLASGSLPAGLTLSSAGVINGTATVLGTFPFTAKVTDSVSTIATQPLVLNVAATGPLDHFSWDYVLAAAYTEIPFAVELSARDSHDRLITTAGGTASITATGNSGASIPVSPQSIVLSNGSFVGYVTISATATSAKIKAVQGSASGTSGGTAVLSGVSTANDGIPDLWKTANGFSTTADVANLDPDGDGQTNWQEFQAGTDPHSDSSTLRILSTDTDAATYFTLQFAGVAGKLYRVSFSEALGTWTPVGATILPASSGTQSVTVPLSGSPAGFFRVEIVP